jgi:glutamyl-tRNA reductase
VIIVLGVSHHRAPVAVRERLAFPKEALGAALLRLRAETGAGECVILSTCNRVELLVESAEETATQALRSFLTGYHAVALPEIEPFLHCLTGEEAIRHAFEVAASLDSMVIGEAQILGQVKAAYQAAVEAGTLGPVLTTLRDRTLAAAKRVRSETEIGQNAVSVSHVAVELARKIFGDLAGRRVLLVGAGKMSELAARQLVSGGALATVLGGRTFARADALARALGGQAAPLEALRQEMARADVVISSTGAPGIVVHREDVEQARRARGSRPLFLVDIATPRDVDPAVRDLPGVFLYDMDDLKAVAQANLKTRERQAASARGIVEQEIAAFRDWRRSRLVVPLVVELRRRGDDIRKAELERTGALADLTPQQRQALEAVATAIVNKLLHSPTVFLKDATRTGEVSELGLVSRLLGLETVPRTASADEPARDASRAAGALRLDPARS